MNIYSRALTSLSVPKLQGTIRDDVSVTGAPLATLDLPALQSVRYLQLSQLPQLSSLAAPNLAWASSVDVESAPQLTQLSLPALTNLLNLYLRDNATLASISMPLVHTGGYSGSFIVTNNPTLPTCMAQALATQGQWCQCGTQISGDDDAAVCH